jgi:hypothetical protein
MALGGIAQLMGFGAWLGAAVSVYFLFRFLDRKASAAATRTIAAWMKGESYRRLDLTATVISSFDLLYGTPLLRVRSFVRSALLSLAGTLLYIFIEL